jgi:hypothetical protein
MLAANSSALLLLLIQTICDNARARSTFVILAQLKLVLGIVNPENRGILLQTKGPSNGWDIIAAVAL